MRILIFTLLLSLISAGSLFSQQEWNISSDDFNALGTITSDTTVNGLTIYATSEKTVVVEPNDKTLGDMVFTTRMKLGGNGSLTEGGMYRILAFDVEANTKISIAAISSSSSADREMLFINATTGDTLSSQPVYGAAISMVEYEYTGEATTMYVASAASGINVYYLKTEVISEPIVSDDALAIFDPEAIDESTLPEGITIVELDGKKYAQVILNSWSSSFPVNAFDLTGMTHFTAETKYAGGVSGFEVSTINTFLKLVDNSSDAWAELAASGVKSHETFKVDKVALATTGTATHVQVAGQETTGWNAVVGDTLFIGKIRAINVDPMAIFDPDMADPDMLPEGSSIVEIEGKKYVQVILNGWSSSIPVLPFTLPEEKMDFTVKTKYSVGASGFEIDKIKTFLKMVDDTKEDWAELSAAGVPSKAEFTKNRLTYATAGTVTNIQIAGQETTGWNAVVGDTLWFGKWRLAEALDPMVIVDPATIDPADLATGWEVVDIEGTKYFKVLLQGWNTVQPIDAYTFPEGCTGMKMMVKYEEGTSGFTYDKVNTFLKLTDANWAEICASGQGSSTEFKEYTVNIADISLAAANLQVAGQETTGWDAVEGDYLYISKVTAVVPVERTTPVIFVVDDSKYKSLTEVVLRGSWLQASGEYDALWDGGIDQTNMYDDGTHGDATAGDNIWTVSMLLVSDAGANTWEWGFFGNGTWIPKANIQFSLPDASAVTSTYTIGGTGIDNLGITLNVYPNPTSGILNIEGTNLESVEVYNLTGARILTNRLSNNRIDVSNLNNGVYILKIVTENGETAVSRFSKR